MPNILLQCFYLMLPAYFANMAPVIVKKINFLKVPIDFNRKINNMPVFGKNKTFRGLFFGVLFSIVVAYIQFVLNDNGIFLSLAIADYSNWLLIGLLMGFGAIIGDLAESFVKRRLSFKSGEGVFPFDQIDFVVGALIFVYPLVKLSVSKIAIIILLSIVLHIIVNHAAFYAKVRDKKW